MNPIRFIVNLFPRRTVAPIPCYKSFFSNSTIAMHSPCFGNSCPDTAFIKFQSHDPWPSVSFSFHRSHLRPALVRRTMSDTIETATLYERHMRSSSRSDEEQLQIEFRPVTATSDPQKTRVLRMQPRHQATLTQPFQCDLQWLSCKTQ